MKVLSFYPPDNKDFRKEINNFTDEIRKSCLKFSINSMATIIYDDCDKSFRNLKKIIKTNLFLQ